MGLLDRLPGFTALTTLAKHVRLGEIRGAVDAYQHATQVVAAADWGDADDVGGVIDAVLRSAKEAAEVSVTTVDDAVVAAITEVSVANRQFLIAAIQWFAANPDADEQTFCATPLAMTASGEQGASWIKLALELWAWIRERRNAR